MIRRLPQLAFLIVVSAAQLGFAQAAATGPWDLKRLSVAPEAVWGAASEQPRTVYFQGEPFQGKPTRVFAYYARPKSGEGPFPGMILLHGGGGKAFPQWAKLWAERGYCALAIDLAGHGPDGKRLPDGGPNQDDGSKFSDFDDATLRDRWTYHAVANAVLGHSLLAAQKEVDPQRTGVTGISWGGYLTCIVAGVDSRFQVAVPVYGCGFLDHNSYWLPGHFDKMDAARRARWVKNFDPASYLGNVGCPTLFVNGTNDFAYPLDSYQKSYDLVDQKLRNLCVTVNMPHGHEQGWAPQEIGLFVDSVLKKELPLAKFAAPELKEGIIRASVAAKVAVASAELHFTTDQGAWQKRVWKSQPAKLAGSADAPVVTAELPAARPLVAFLTAKDKRGAVVSSRHVELK